MKLCVIIYNVALICFSKTSRSKVHPRRGHAGPDGGGWLMPRPGHFTPGKDLLPIV